MQARSGVESCRAHPISGVQQYPVAHVRRRVSARNEPSGMHDLWVSCLNLIAPDMPPTIRHRVLPPMQGQKNPHMPVFPAVLRRDARILRRNAAKRCGICVEMTLAARLNMAAAPAITCAGAGPRARKARHGPGTQDRPQPLPGVGIPARALCCDMPSGDRLFQDARAGDISCAAHQIGHRVAPDRASRNARQDLPRRGGSFPPGRGAPFSRGLRAPGLAPPGGI